ncbi:MAG TPA: GAF domain-containing protein [Solirubrobacteraceae bacterium]|nr:GAF domain-containing protein [Solirubrobacteraceae bacterium]
MIAGEPVRRLRALSEAALQAGAPGELVNALSAAVRELLAVDQVHAIEVSQDATVGHAQVMAFDRDDADAYVQVIDERPSGTARVVASRDVVHVPDTRADDTIRADYVDRFDAASALFVPLIWDGDVRWVVVLVSRTPRTFGDDEIELARLLANQAAAGLALLEAREGAEAGGERRGALARAAHAVKSAGDLNRVLAALACEAAQAVGGDMAGVYLGDGERGGVATAGWNTPEGWVGYLMKPGEGVAGQVLLSGRPAISNAYQSDVRLPTNPGLRQLQTAVSVPMTVDDRTVGALSVGFRRMRRVSPLDLRTLEAVADLAAVAVRTTP